MKQEKIKEKIKEKEDLIKRLEQEYFINIGEIKQLKELLKEDSMKESKK